MPADPSWVDFAVAGAGFGGLATAALLLKQGHSVVVLEASGLPGGCGQTFRRGPYRFDAGATTICGAEGDLPLSRLAEALDLDLGLTRVDPGMSVWLGGARIDRHTDRQAWIEEACSHFGSTQRQFWKELFRVSDLGWRVAQRANRFPPADARDLLHAASVVGLDALKLVPSMVTSTARCLRRRLGAVPAGFARFVDEQLLITAQAGASDVPLLVGAMGLTYTNYGNYSSPGGVGGLAETLVRTIRSSGGAVRYGQRVERIEAIHGGYRLRTRRGDVLARRVVSNLTIWNMGDIGDGVIGEHFRRQRLAQRDAWGAFTVYLGVKHTFGDELALHHQILFDEPLPITGSQSVFVSISPRDDATRAPEGLRAVTVSTHTDVSPWWALEGPAYEDAKERVVEAILERVTNNSQIGQFAVQSQLSGTPRTFVRYTNRTRGRVGGIPSTFGALAAAAGPVTPFDGLYLVGDTTYPGQGIPAVVLGALNVAGRIGHASSNSLTTAKQSAFHQRDTGL